MTDTDPLKLLYLRLRDNVTPGVAGDVMQLLTAVHEAAFPDGEDAGTVTSGLEAVKRIAYGEGWDDGYGEGWDDGYGEGWDDGYDEGWSDGYSKAVLRFGGGGEA